MTATMKDYIIETPISCKKIINNRKALLKGFVEKLWEKDYKRLVIIASGSSYNAALSSRFFIEKYLKIEVKVMNPFLFTHYETFYSETDLLLGISQSGRSTSTIKAMDKAIKEKMNGVVLTNNPDQPIGKCGAEIINLACGVETVGYVTKGYTATVLHLMLMALEGALELERISSQEYLERMEELTNLVKNMSEIIEITEKWYEKNSATLLNAKRLMVIGAGPNWGSALESALKIGEAVRIPSTGYELEEFMHGPYLELSKEHTVFFLSCRGKGAHRVDELFKFTGTIAEATFCVTNQFCGMNKEKLLILEAKAEEEMMPLVMAMPIQIVTYNLCRDLKIRLDIDPIPNFGQVLNSKSTVL